MAKTGGGKVGGSKKSNWGGRRPGAGRKPKIPGQPGVSHMSRPTLTGKHPVHVSLRLSGDVDLRRATLQEPLFDALREGSQRGGFRLCHFAVVEQRLHLIVEADDSRALATGLQGLTSRLARRMNQALERSGRFFADRYAGRELRTSAEAHQALRALFAPGSAGKRGRAALDAFSSGAWFDGWSAEPPGAARVRKTIAAPVAPATTRLLRDGWRKLGTIALR
jgi:hypothetical protein